MSEIVLENITKRWGDTLAVDDLTTRADSGKFLVLLGPSGCGKSTTLRMIAGLEDVTSGRIRIGRRDVTGLPPAQRGLSMVFQSYALFPHLNVAENIVFGLKVRRRPAAERAERLKRVTTLVGLSDYLDRKPAQLSGGQRQRVALARAIIAENPICLMDEPLSNLDAKLRHEMRVEIRELQQRLGITMIYVTHDQDEAMSLADKVILLRDGRIEQEATPAEMYEHPASLFAAGFIGTPPMSLINLELVSQNDPGHVFTEIVERHGPKTVVGIRPEAIRVASEGGVPATLLTADYRGADTIVTAEIFGQQVTLRVPGRLEVRRSQAVNLDWPEEAVHVFDAKTGRRINTPGGNAGSGPVPRRATSLG